MNERVARYEMIQVLRFIAATLVVCAHSFLLVREKIAAPWLALPATFFGWGSGWAVTLFFCISGFVIAHSAQKINSLEFLLRRFLRIYSGYLLAVLVVFIAKSLIFHKLATEEISVGALTLFPLGAITYPLWIEWSLVFEVFFYVLFAIVWISRSNRAIISASLIWLALIAWRSMDEFSPRLVTAGQIFFSARNIPFILGVLSYFCFNKISGKFKNILLVAGVALAFSMNILVSDFWVIASQSVSVLCIVLWAANTEIKSESPLVDFGNYSYGIYLIHTSVIAILLSATPLRSADSLVAVVTAFLISMTCGLLFGFVEHHLHERLKTLLLRSSWIERFTGLIPKFRAAGA